MIPRLFSKKLKNRNPIDYTNQTEGKYTKLNHQTYVYTNCKKRYRNCPLVKFIYDSSFVQRKTDVINFRKVIDLTTEKFEELYKNIKKRR